MTPSPYFFIKRICLENINMFARFDEIQTMTQDIEKTKRYGQTNGRMHTQEDNMKTVYPLASDVEMVLPSYSFICKF